MQPHLKNAIVQFIANEFKLEPESVRDDLSFSDDLGLTPEAAQDLFQRLQDALDFVLPEDTTAVETLGDLFEKIQTELPVEEATDLV